MEALANIGISWSLWVVLVWWVIIILVNWESRNIDTGKLGFFVIFVPAAVILLDFLLGK
jgi:predicted transporter